MMEAARSSKTNLETYFSETLQAPSADECKDFFQAFEEINDRATREAGEHEVVREVVMKAKNKKVRENRLKRIDQMISILKQHLDDKWSDFLTEHKDNRIEFKDYSILFHDITWSVVRFKSGTVHSMLSSYIHAPSKITKKAIKKVADDLNKLFISIFKVFLTYSFLSDEGEEGVLKRGGLENNSTLEQLRYNGAFAGDYGTLPSSTVVFSEHIEKGNFLDALHFLNESSTRDLQSRWEDHF